MKFSTIYRSRAGVCCLLLFSILVSILGVIIGLKYYTASQNINRLLGTTSIQVLEQSRKHSGFGKNRFTVAKFSSKKNISINDFSGLSNIFKADEYDVTVGYNYCADLFEDIEEISNFQFFDFKIKKKRLSGYLLINKYPDRSHYIFYHN